MKASAAMELEDENRKIARNNETSGPLDPLLKKLCEEFVDDHDLTEKLKKLFKVNQIGYLYCFKICLNWNESETEEVHGLFKKSRKE